MLNQVNDAKLSLYDSWDPDEEKSGHAAALIYCLIQN
jgi:hypothetical protein